MFFSCFSLFRLKVLHLYGSAHLPTEREIREVNTAVKVYPLPDWQANIFTQLDRYTKHIKKIRKFHWEMLDHFENNPNKEAWCCVTHHISFASLTLEYYWKSQLRQYYASVVWFCVKRANDRRWIKCIWMYRCVCLCVFGDGIQVYDLPSWGTLKG